MSSPDDVSQIYFLQPVTGGPIKIGCSIAPEERLATYASWSPLPLQLLVAVPGGLPAEAGIHKEFLDERLHHEWFRPSGRLLKLIDEIKANGCLPGRFVALDRMEEKYDTRTWRPRLGTILKDAGISRAEMAKGLGVSLGTVANWSNWSISGRRIVEVVGWLRGQGVDVRAADLFQRVQHDTPKKKPSSVSEMVAEAVKNAPSEVA
ncbi:MAG: GIY-YIG nuclease family protein [Acidobacteriota bacterium]